MCRGTLRSSADKNQAFPTVSPGSGFRCHPFLCLPWHTLGTWSELLKGTPGKMTFASQLRFGMNKGFNLEHDALALGEDEAAGQIILKSVVGTLRDEKWFAVRCDSFDTKQQATDVA